MLQILFDIFLRGRAILYLKLIPGKLWLIYNFITFEQDIDKWYNIINHVVRITHQRKNICLKINKYDLQIWRNFLYHGSTLFHFYINLKYIYFHLNFICWDLNYICIFLSSSHLSLLPPELIIGDKIGGEGCPTLDEE